MKRRMTCSNCGHIWQRDGLATGPESCPMCDLHICACGCGADLGDARADARYAGRACYMALTRADGGETPRQRAHAARTTAPLQEVREGQEAVKDHWSQIVYNGIIECLRSGSFHADDLEPLGIPDEHRNLIGSQTGSLVSRGYITEVSRRKSVNPRRKGAKSGVFNFTQTGREKLVGQLDFEAA